MTNVIEIKNQNDFNSFKENDKEKLHVIKLGAEWCGPCKIVSNLIKNRNNTNNVVFAEINVEDDEVSDIVSEFNVRNIPMLIFIKNGEIIDKYTGSVNSSMLDNLINKHLC